MFLRAKKNLLLLLLLLLTGCLPLLSPAPPLPPVEGLEEGDVVVTFAGGLSSWFTTLAFTPERALADTSFSHAEMVYRDRDGELMLGGVFQGGPGKDILAERMKKFHRFAVFRAQAPQQKRKAAADLLRGWLEDPKITGAEFDYFFAYEPGKKSALFCAGIVNEAYRVAGLPIPFAYLRWDANNKLAGHVEDIVGRRLQRLLDLHSIENSPSFTRILVGHNQQNEGKSYEPRAKKIVRYLIHQYEKGFRLQPSDAFNLFLEARFLPDSIERLFYYQVSLQRFAEDVDATWDRLERRGGLAGLAAPAKEAIFLDICNKYREKYFFRPVALRAAD